MRDAAKSRISDVSWDDLRLFAAIVRDGSISAAAACFGISQPTASRRLSALQRAIGTPIIQRTGRGYVLTDEGEDILARVKLMSGHALELERRYVGSTTSMAGRLRISSPEWVATHVLTPCLYRLPEHQPGLEIELIADSYLSDLNLREAELCLRLQPFSGAQIVQRRLTRIRYGLYASASYLADRGVPEPTDDTVRLIGMGSRFDTLPCMQWLRQQWPKAGFGFRSDDRNTQARACLEGAGLCVLPLLLGDSIGLVRIAERTPPERIARLGFHGDLRGLQRLRFVLDFLIAEVPADI